MDFEEPWILSAQMLPESKSYPFCKYLLIIDNSCSIVHHQSTLGQLDSITNRPLGGYQRDSRSNRRQFEGPANSLMAATLIAYPAIAAC